MLFFQNFAEKKYSNLCALCEKPEQCNYPDKFSGYDGAIRCLDKGQGDVAFTKVQFIKKYFGVSLKMHNSKPTSRRLFEESLESNYKLKLTSL